ncbi:MAG: glutathione peroxidase [Candidatus Melainabacteria bacterium HGW-Melainabacteria-1]|nr:MAG: glutathione peroxidase [Candidatus Melainabacteria bacterium HGW-Melainabacteria-1]
MSQQTSPETSSHQPLFEIPLRRIDGTEASLADYQGQVLLLVNVASECGLTPQYEALEKLYQTYRSGGLMVLGFPANEFGAQEPGSNEQIASFCRSKFGVDFPLFEKIVVKGQGQHPLYGLLTQAIQTPLAKDENSLYQRLAEKGMGPEAEGDILWNFEKFLISRSGAVVARFAPHVAPDDPRLIAALESELAKE